MASTRSLSDVRYWHLADKSERVRVEPGSHKKAKSLAAGADVAGHLAPALEARRVVVSVLV